MEKCTVDLKERTFIDVGCGLGSIIWGMAFQNKSLLCIGVENAARIYEGAQKVHEGLRAKGIEPTNVELVHSDAIKYLSSISQAGIIYCYDQGFEVIPPRAAPRAATPAPPPRCPLPRPRLWCDRGVCASIRTWTVSRTPSPTSSSRT